MSAAAIRIWRSRLSERIFSSDAPVSQKVLRTRPFSVRTRARAMFTRKTASALAKANRNPVVSAERIASSV